MIFRIQDLQQQRQSRNYNLKTIFNQHVHVTTPSKTTLLPQDLSTILLRQILIRRAVLTYSMVTWKTFFTISFAEKWRKKVVLHNMLIIVLTWTLQHLLCTVVFQDCQCKHPKSNGNNNESQPCLNVKYKPHKDWIQQNRCLEENNEQFKINWLKK